MRIIVSIFVGLLFSFSIFAQTEGEIIVPKTFLRKAPNSTAEIVRAIERGDVIKFEASKKDENWYYVSIAQGKIKGWVSRNTVRRLSEKAQKVEEMTWIEESDKMSSATQKPKQTLPVTASPKTSRVVVVESTLPKSPPKSQPISTTQTNTSPKVEKPISQPSIPVSSPVTANPSESTTPSAPANPAVPSEPEVFEDKEVVRVETEEVTLNVRVVDSNNRNVRNLNQSQFNIYEDDVLQPISSFTTSEVPIVNALLIDNSRSLRAQLGKIVEAGKIFLSANKTVDKSAVVRFVSRDKIEVVQDFTNNKGLLANALDNMFIEGGQTALFDAIYRSAKKIDEYQNSQKKEDIKIRALILVSDGDDRGSSYGEEKLFELLRMTQVQIYAIGFTNNLSTEVEADGKNRQEKAKAFLNRLAQETGGKVYYPKSADELSQIASEISAELRTQYSLSYSPTSEGKGASFRKIKVLIDNGANNEKRTAITRTGRTVSPK